MLAEDAEHGALLLDGLPAAGGSMEQGPWMRQRLRAAERGDLPGEERIALRPVVQTQLRDGDFAVQFSRSQAPYLVWAQVGVAPGVCEDGAPVRP